MTTTVQLTTKPGSVPATTDMYTSPALGPAVCATVTSPPTTPVVGPPYTRGTWISLPSRGEWEGKWVGEYEP